MLVQKKSKVVRNSFLISMLVILGLFAYALTSKLMERSDEQEVFAEVTPIIKLPQVKEEEVVKPFDTAEVAMDFYDGSNGAIVSYEGVYRPSQGMDFVKDGEAFSIYSMMSGMVKDVRADALLGNSVSIQHEEYLITYQSLEDVQVKVGDEVSVGSVLGKAGRNMYSAQLGNHLHLVVEKNGTITDPKTLIDFK